MKIEYLKSKKDLIEKIRKEIPKYGGKLIGDYKSGHFSVNSQIGCFKGLYKVDDKFITLTFEKKPILISKKLIENQIKNYLSKF
jgi:hypothetical protein